MSQVYENDYVRQFEKKLFFVRVKMMQSRSVSNIRYLGNYMSGIREFDEDIPNQTYNRYMTIKDMVQHYKGGNQIYVPGYVGKKKVDQVGQIYVIVEKYLDYWREKLQYGVNLGDAPVEDLIEADMFADSLFNYAKYGSAKNKSLSSIYQSLTSVQRVNHHNFFTSGYKPYFTQTQESVNKDEEELKRESLGEFFKEITSRY